MVAQVANLNPKTPIELGLLITVISFLVGTIWWASSIQTKMDVLLVTVNKCATGIETTNHKTNEVDTNNKLLTHDVRALESRVSELEKRK